MIFQAISQAAKKEGYRLAWLSLEIPDLSSWTSRPVGLILPPDVTSGKS